jgi:hypothetical protein
MGAPDFTHPLPADLYDAPGPDVLDFIRDNDAACASWLEGLDPPGKQAGFKRLNAGLVEEWNGTAWVPKPLAYIPLTGTASATGSISTTVATGPGGYSVKVTDAPADKRVTALSGNTAGESYFGRRKDDGSAWTAGIKVGVDGKLYDIASGQPILSGTLNYLPLTGGELSGDLTIRKNDPALWLINSATGQKGEIRVQTDKNWVFRAFDTAAVEKSAFYCDGASGSYDWSIWKAGGGAGKIWHAGNDGQGSGLDADMLRGFVPDGAANGNTIAWRDGTGMTDFQIVRTWQYIHAPYLRGGANAAGTLRTWGDSNNVNFRWATWGGWQGSALAWRVDEGLERQIIDSSHVTGNMQYRWGWFKCGPGYMQFQVIGTTDDGFSGSGLPINFPNHITIPVGTVNIAQGITGNSIVSNHVNVQTSQTIAVGVSCNFTLPSVEVYVMTAGY